MKADSKENYIPLSTIYGKPNPDGTYTLTAIDIKNLNDNLYALAKKIQGGLTFADMTKEVNQEYSNMEGDITQVQITAEGLSTRVSNAEGGISTLEQTADGLATRVSSTEQGIITVTNATTGLSSDVAAITTNVSTLEQTASSLSATVTQVQNTANSASGTANSAYSKAQQVELTVDGFTVSDGYGNTTINGDKIRSGTIEGVTLLSTNSDNNSMVKIFNGGVDLGEAPYYNMGSLYYDINGGKVHLYSVPGRPIKIESGSNMSIDSSGTIYIGTSAYSSGNVNIGDGTGTIRLIGNVLVNGVPIGGVD